MSTITLSQAQLAELADMVAERLGSADAGGERAVAVKASTLIDANAAAAQLGVPVSWVRAEARAGRLPSVPLGRYVRFRPDELDAWADARARGAVRGRTGSNPVSRRREAA